MVLVPGRGGGEEGAKEKESTSVETPDPSTKTLSDQPKPSRRTCIRLDAGPPVAWAAVYHRVPSSFLLNQHTSSATAARARSSGTTVRRGARSLRG